MEGPNSTRPQATAEAEEAGTPKPHGRAHGTPAVAEDGTEGDLSGLARLPTIIEPVPSRQSDMRRRNTQQTRRSTQDGRSRTTVGRTTAHTRRTNFSLAGPEDTSAVRTAHEPFVHPGYAELNPQYEQPQNTKPVWSLAKPLPRVVRPGMIPTREELIQQSLKPELPAENSQKLRVDVDPNDLEAGRVQASLDPAKVRAQTKDARLQRENNFLNAIQRGGGVTSRMSRQQSARQSRTSSDRRRRPYREPRPDAMSTTYEEEEPDSDEDEAGPPGYAPRTSDNGQRPQDTLAQDHASMTTLGADDIDDDAIDQKFPEDLDVEDILDDLIGEEVHNNHTSWSVWRTQYREALAELLGVIVQLTFGFSADLAVTIADAGNPNTTSWAWGFATMAAIYVSGGISGAHFNPIVTIVLWFYRGFPARKMPEYFAAQFLGAFLAAFIAYGVYYSSIQSYLAANESAGVVNSFVTSQRYTYIDAVTAFFNEFVGTAFLLIVILALGDDQNAPPGAGMNAFIVGLVIMLLGVCFAYQTGAALNPARDFGPRLAMLALGYGGELYTNPYWFYGPWAATFCGGMVGAGIYDFAIFTGGESPLNYSWERTSRAALKSKKKWVRRLHLAKKEKEGLESEDQGMKSRSR